MESPTAPDIVTSMRSFTHSGEGLTIWFTGLSGAGKTTLANALAEVLLQHSLPIIVLDGDVLRQSLCAGLGFSHDDRMENVRRLGELAARLASEGRIVLVAAIAPYRESRLALRHRLTNFIEVYVNAPLQVCIERDPKGLYGRAVAGEIPNFTGIGDPYEEPVSPDIECRTDLDTVSVCLATLISALSSIRPQRIA